MTSRRSNNTTPIEESLLIDDSFESALVSKTKAATILTTSSLLSLSTTTTTTTTTTKQQRQRVASRNNSSDSIKGTEASKKQSNTTNTSSYYTKDNNKMTNRSSSSSSIVQILQNDWKESRTKFLWAQVQVAIVLLIAYIGNNWPVSYPRNDNHNMTMFWLLNGSIAIVAIVTMKYEGPSDLTSTSTKLQVLSRSQTEEWKGWMQWMFIMYHYYRAYTVYNEIRVFVSAYVWMTGFGNFLYFDKKQDFSFERVCSMWLRINYFPLLLSYFIGVPLDLFYIVPLHTTAFVLTMLTCLLAKKIQEARPTLSKHSCNVYAIGICLIAHVVFYETSAVELLRVLFGNEIHFRFQADKYSAPLGIVAGFSWGYFTNFINWCYNTSHVTQQQVYASYIFRTSGVVLIVAWYMIWGYNPDKFTYNPVHPQIFWIPMMGYLMLRNSSKYLTQIHSTALEFFGKITLETYVLQFMLFMCKNVQHIPVVIPGATADGNAILKFCNMVLCGIIFVSIACWARKITVTTQTTITELLHLLISKNSSTTPVAITVSSSNGDSDNNNNNNKFASPKSVDTAEMTDSDEEMNHHNSSSNLETVPLTAKSADV